MANENSTPEGSKKAEGNAALSLIQTAFPEQPTIVFGAAIILGLLLIFMTTLLHSYFAVNGTQSNLILCVGVALVLVAFGGQATVRVGGIIMAGAAGVALGLFVYLQQSSSNLFLQGRIKDFDFNAYQSLAIKEKNEILGRVVQASDLKKSYYDFVIFKTEIDNPFMEVTLTTRPTADNQTKERVVRVPVAIIEPFFGGQQRLEWELREQGHGPDSVLSLFDRSQAKTVAREDQPGFARTLTGPMSTGLAFAAESSKIDFPLMLTRLKAEDASTRRGARDALSEAPIDFIPVMMKTFHDEYSNYQVRLGICVALAEMLRNDKQRAAEISAKLREDDLNRLLDAAGDPDRTVRVYAGEFLFDLGDIRTTKLAIPRAAEAGDDNARFNWLLVSQDGWRHLSPAEKAALAAPLAKAKGQSGERTLKLFEKLPM